MAVWDRFVGWLLFEKRFSIESADLPAAIEARLKANLEPRTGMRNFNPFAFILPFHGSVRNGGALLRSSTKAPRALDCTLEEIDRGTRLNGKLRLQGTPVVFALIYPLIFVSFILYECTYGNPRLNILEGMLSFVVMFAFMRGFARVLLWWNKGREEDLLNDLENVMRPIRVPFPSAQSSRSDLATTSTEIFIRPRKSLDR